MGLVMKKGSDAFAPKPSENGGSRFAGWEL
jgi:hypothetical protein